jgi:ferritin-like metal-binding protein YciE
MNTLQDLFLDQLADIYYAENQLVKALPKMVKAATHEQLKEAFQSHLRETEAQRTKVERVFKAFDEKVRSEKCEAILGLIEEAEEIASEHKGAGRTEPMTVLVESGLCPRSAAQLPERAV